MEYKLSILHAYRHLLRATTYLPDSLARVRVHNEIVNRFRKRTQRPLVHRTTSETLRSLQKYTRRVSGAADLQSRDLAAVLRFTYGRRGSSRRVLLGLVRTAPDEDVPPDEAALESFISKETGTETEAAQGSGPGDSPKLMALLRSQKENQTHVERTRLKELEPKIPEENIWARKTPVKARRNMEKKWWAKTLKKAIPPVDVGEWERLRDLAQGRLVENVPARRGATMTSVMDEEVSSPEKGASFLEDCMTHVRGSHQTRELLGRRGLRRLYATIWSQTPTMAWDPVKKTWETKWGFDYSMAKIGVEAVPRATGSQLELFEGLDNLASEVDKQAGREEKKEKKKGKKERGKGIES